MLSVGFMLLIGLGALKRQERNMPPLTEAENRGLAVFVFLFLILDIVGILATAWVAVSIWGR